MASLFSAGQNYTICWCLKAWAACLEHDWSRSSLRRELICKRQGHTADLVLEAGFNKEHGVWVTISCLSSSNISSPTLHIVPYPHRILHNFPWNYWLMRWGRGGKKCPQLLRLSYSTTKIITWRTDDETASACFCFQIGRTGSARPSSITLCHSSFLPLLPSLSSRCQIIPDSIQFWMQQNI